MYSGTEPQGQRQQLLLGQQDLGAIMPLENTGDIKKKFGLRSGSLANDGCEKLFFGD